MPVEDDHATLGLPAPSLIRTEKIAVIETKVAEWRGDIGTALLAQVRAKLRLHLAL